MTGLGGIRKSWRQSFLDGADSAFFAIPKYNICTISLNYPVLFAPAVLSSVTVALLFSYITIWDSSRCLLWCVVGGSANVAVSMSRYFGGASGSAVIFGTPAYLKFFLRIWIDCLRRGSW